MKKLTESVKPVLRFYLKSVVESDTSRLWKGGYATFATLRDSTKLNLTKRVKNQHDYPACLYDEADCCFFPVLLTDKVCSLAEGYMINLLWNRDSVHARGEFPVGTNRKGAINAYGDVQLSHMHPGCLYIHSVRAGIDMKVHDEQLDAHKKEAEIRRIANKENIAPIKTQPIDSFFSTKIPPVDLSRQDLVDGILEEELFPETVEILLESNSKEDMNAMISSLQFGGTDIPHVSDETYEDLRRARNNQSKRKSKDNGRKRANGENVDTHGNLKLAASERAVIGSRACKFQDCRKKIQLHLKDGTGEGYCQTHAPKSFLESFLESKNCSHPGCTKERRSGYDGKCKSHVDRNNAKYIATKQKDKAYMAKRREAKKNK